MNETPAHRGVLLINFEPAPYIRSLATAIRSEWSGRLDVLYVTSSMTQQWDDVPLREYERVLPPGSVKKFRDIARAVMSRKYALVHLAGWGGHPVVGHAMVLAGCTGMPLTIESDTRPYHEEPRWKAAVKKAIYPYLFKKPSMFLPGGTPQAKYLQQYGVPENRIRIVKMTVDVKSIRAFCRSASIVDKERWGARAGLKAQSVRILYVGRLEPYKGLRDLISAFESLQQCYAAVELLIVGAGTMAAEIAEMAAKCANVHLLGQLDKERVWQAYCVSDIFVLPSHSDQWGLVINEAMAAGLPTIVTDRVGCADDLVRPGKSGLVVPANQRDALLLALEKLVAAPEIRMSMGAEAVKIIDEWTIENQARRIVGAWNDVLEVR